MMVTVDGPRPTFFTSEVLTQMALCPLPCPHNRPGRHGIRNSTA